MSNENSDYGEPWRLVKRNGRTLIYLSQAKIGHAHEVGRLYNCSVMQERADRILSCVNACANITNPSEAIRLAREALETAKTHAEYCTDPVLRKAINDALSQLTPK